MPHPETEAFAPGAALRKEDSLTRTHLASLGFAGAEPLTFETELGALEETRRLRERNSTGGHFVNRHDMT